MGTGNSSKAKGGESSQPRPDAGRAARRKVELPSGALAGSSSSAAPGAPRKRRPAAPPRPWYRRGRFWLIVIVVEVIVALGLSIRFMPRTDDVALDGADLGRFCSIVAENQSLVPSSTTMSAGDIADAWGKQSDALRALEPVAPDEVRADIDELVVLTQGVRDLAADVVQRNRSDPAYDGSSTINAKVAQAQTEGDRATRRLNLAVLKGCGVDLSTPRTTPSTVPGPPAPTAPTAPVVGPSVAPAEGGTGAPNDPTGSGTTG